MPKATSQEISLEKSAPACAVKARQQPNLSKVPDGDSRGTPSTPAGRQSGEPRLRVLHVIDRMEVGGTEVGILKVIRGLGQECFEHRICSIGGNYSNFPREVGFSSK